MTRYILTLSYRGAALSGWQSQKNAVTVQGELDRALGILLGQSVQTVGAGRTDAGVNAVNYVCHFDASETFHLTKQDFLYKINAITRRDIVVHDIRLAPAQMPHSDSADPAQPSLPEGPGEEGAASEFHARFSATARQYRYFLHSAKDPFAEGFSWRCPYPLDTDAMNRAAALLLGEHDFSCFEKTGGNNATSICTVFKAQWERYTPQHCSLLGFPDDGGYLVFTVEANRFLRNMVRAMVGTLVDVGRGRRSPESVGELLRSGKRSDAGESVPGTALFLSEIRY